MSFIRVFKLETFINVFWECAVSESIISCASRELFIKCLPSKHFLVLKTSSTRLQRNNFSSSRRLQDVLEDEKLLRWRSFQDVFKTCLEDVLKTCLEDVLKMLWRQTKYLLRISDLTNLNVYLTNLYFTNLYLPNLRRIQNGLIRTQ